VCITTYAGSILCLRASDGKRLWITYVSGTPSATTASTPAPRRTAGRRVHDQPLGQIVALNARTGKHRVEAAASLVGVFDAGRRRRQGLHRRLRRRPARVPQDRRKELWKAYVGGRILGGPLLVGNLVFFSTLEQRTYAARANDGKVVWRFPIGKVLPGIATERAYYFTLNGILVALRGKAGPASGVRHSRLRIDALRVPPAPDRRIAASRSRHPARADVVGPVGGEAGDARGAVARRACAPRTRTRRGGHPRAPRRMPRPPVRARCASPARPASAAG